MLDKSNPEQGSEQGPKPVTENVVELDQPNVTPISDIPKSDEAPAASPPKNKRSWGHRIMMFARAIFQFVLMIGVLAGAYTLMDRLVNSREEPTKRPFREATFTVDSMEAVQTAHRPSILVYGQVETARDVELRPLVSGEIIAVNDNLTAGMRVEKDDLLVSIDPFNYEGAIREANANLLQVQASVREIDARLASENDQLISAQDQLELARADLERAQSLAASGTLTNKQVDDRVLVVSQRSQSVSQRRNNIIINEAQKEQQLANIERLEWKLNEAERQLKNTKLYAPFSGVVSNANAEPGRSVGSNDVLVSIYDDSQLESRFTLTNAQYGRMATDSDPLIGREVEIIWTIGTVSYSYKGEIDRIGATVAAERGGVEVVARIKPEDHAAQIRPGAFVEILVPDRAYNDAIKVPETSIYDQSHVFIIEEGQLVRKDIEILAFDGSSAIIKGKDEAALNSGDKILTTRLTEATEGARVRAPGKAELRQSGARRQSNGAGQRPEGAGQRPNSAGERQAGERQRPGGTDGSGNNRQRPNANNNSEG
ncbi:MAG: efflux RND transporter periplasmic adaptor subunit [Lentilitoribacter sp.]